MARYLYLALYFHNDNNNNTPAQDDNLKKTRSNPGNEKKDLDMRHSVPAATEHRYEENGKVDEILTISV